MPLSGPLSVRSLCCSHSLLNVSGFLLGVSFSSSPPVTLCAFLSVFLSLFPSPARLFSTFRRAPVCLCSSSSETQGCSQMGVLINSRLSVTLLVFWKGKTNACMANTTAVAAGLSGMWQQEGKVLLQKSRTFLRLKGFVNFYFTAAFLIIFLNS